MSQANGAPPEQWKERKDLASRQIIDHVDRARHQLVEAMEAKLDERLKPHVTWPGVGGSFVALLAMVATLMLAITAPQRDAIASERKERLEQNKDMATEFRELRKAMEADRKELTNAVTAIKDVIVEGKARREAREEFQRKTKEP